MTTNTHHWPAYHYQHDNITGLRYRFQDVWQASSQIGMFKETEVRTSTVTIIYSARKLLSISILFYWMFYQIFKSLHQIALVQKYSKYEIFGNKSAQMCMCPNMQLWIQVCISYYILWTFNQHSYILFRIRLPNILCLMKNNRISQST